MLRCRDVTRAYLHGTSTEGNSSSNAGTTDCSPPTSLLHSPRPRASLKRVLFLVDGRHGLKHTDATFLQQLFAPHDSNINSSSNNSSNISIDSGTDCHGILPDGVVGADCSRNRPSPSPKHLSPKWKLQVVLTKCDLVERNDLARRMAAVHGQLRCTKRDHVLYYIFLYVFSLSTIFSLINHS